MPVGRNRGAVGFQKLSYLSKPVANGSFKKKRKSLKEEKEGAFSRVI